MNIMISGRHLEVTEAIRNHVIEQLEAFFADKGNLKISSIRVILDFEHKHGKVEILVSMKHHEVFGRAEDYDLYKAIDLAVTRLSSQVTRHLKRVKENVGVPMREAEMIFNPA